MTLALLIGTEPVSATTTKSTLTPLQSKIHHFNHITRIPRRVLHRWVDFCTPIIAAQLKPQNHKAISNRGLNTALLLLFSDWFGLLRYRVFVLFHKFGSVVLCLMQMRVVRNRAAHAALRILPIRAEPWITMN
jgi:hypothetical protein